MSVTLLPGDCRAVLATLPDASVQCVVTSPPYANLRDYGHPDQIGAEATAGEYIAELVNVFRLVRRVLRDDGTLWLNLGDGMADKQLRMIPARVALALQADAWVLRSDIIWAKPNPMPESVTDRPTSAHEHVFLLSKRASYYWDAEAVAEEATAFEHGQRYGSTPSIGAAVIPNRNDSGPRMQGGIAPGRATRNIRNVWTIATQPYSGAHFATMPPELAERCIKAGTSERGQCPHCAAPWARVVERGPEKVGIERGKHPSDYRSTGQPQRHANGGLGTRSAETTGWQPTCACPEHAPGPQTVLDCFAGAGTTLLVADRLGRNGVGIELNPDYARLARDRIAADAPLFTNVALSEAAD